MPYLFFKMLSSIASFAKYRISSFVYRSELRIAVLFMVYDGGDCDSVERRVVCYVVVSGVLLLLKKKCSRVVFKRQHFYITVSLFSPYVIHHQQSSSLTDKTGSALISVYQWAITLIAKYG